MTGMEAVTAASVYLNENKASIFGGETKGKVFKYEKTTGYAGEYIAVNNLPFVHRKAHEEGIVNVNIHCPKKKSGEPDTKRLDELSRNVISLFDFADGKKLQDSYFRFMSDSRPTPDSDDTYYVNIQIECIYFDEKTVLID